MLNKYVYRSTFRVQSSDHVYECQLDEDHAAPTSLACIACIFIDVS